MPQITLSRKDVEALNAFCIKHDQKTFFLAKDDGAYIGATGGNEEDGTFENILFYFTGCDPKKDEFWWDECSHKFGGDDFGEQFDTAVLKDHVNDPLATKMVINVTASAIKISSFLKAASKTAAPKKPAAKKAPTKKQTIGSVAKKAIQLGLNNEDALKYVKVAFPKAKTTIGCINWYRNQLTKAA